MAVKIGSLVIKLAVDNALVKPGLDRAQHETAKAAREMRQRWQALGRQVTIVASAIAGAIAGAAAGMTKLAFDSIRTADEISKTAQAIGMGTEELSRLRYAADISGVSFESLQGNLGRFNRGLFDAANGTGKTGEALARLGINIRTAEGGIKTQTQLLSELAARFQRMPDGVQKSALAMQIFGKSGADMIPFLNQGAEGIAKLTEEADRFGVVIDAETGRKAEAFNDNLTRLRGVLDAAATKIAAEMLPTLIELTNWLVRNSDEIGKFIVRIGGFIQQVGNAARGIWVMYEAAQNTWQAFRSWAPWIDTAIDKIDKLARYVNLALNPLNRLLGMLSAVGASASRREGGGPMALMAGDMLLMARQVQASAESMKRPTEELLDAVPKVGKAAKGAAKAVKDEAAEAARAIMDLAQQIRAIEDVAFPDLGRSRRLQDQIDTLMRGERAGVRSREENTRTISRLMFGDPEKEKEDHLAKMKEAADRERKLILDRFMNVKRGAKDLADGTEIHTVRIARTFEEMTERALYATRQLAEGIKNGDFLSILAGVAGLFTTLGSTGLLGSKIQKGLLQTIPGNANGTAYHPGGLMMVGERGPEILATPRGSRVIANHDLRQAGQQTFTLVLEERTDIVEARIDDRIGTHAPKIIKAGSDHAMNRIREARERSLAA